ncbi:MAG: hypothetical protein GX424_06425 [Clostridiales bacterium]|nr:hypothetical protein [Clostridiales bacterium]
MADYYSGDTYLSGSVKSTPVTGSQKWQRVSFTDQMHYTTCYMFFY